MPVVSYPSVAEHRLITDCSILVPGSVFNERGNALAVLKVPIVLRSSASKPDACIATSLVELERLITDARVARGVLIVVTSVLANGDILRAGGVVAERADADGCVLKSSRADNHCAVAYRPYFGDRWYC